MTRSTVGIDFNALVFIPWNGPTFAVGSAVYGRDTHIAVAAAGVAVSAAVAAAAAVSWCC